MIELLTSKNEQTPKYESNTICSIAIIPESDQIISIEIQELLIDFVFVTFSVTKRSDDKEIIPIVVLDGRHKPINPSDPKWHPIKMASQTGFEIKLTYKTKPQSLINIKIKIIATAFIGLKSRNDPCPGFDQYKCASSDACINELLVCDNIDNCADSSDETRCNQVYFVITFAIVTLLFISLFLFGYVLIQAIFRTSPAVKLISNTACADCSQALQFRYDTTHASSKYRRIEDSDDDNCCALDGNEGAIKSETEEKGAKKLGGKKVGDKSGEESIEFELLSSDGVPLISHS